MRFFLPFIISIFLERVPTGPHRRAIRKTRKLSDSQLPKETCPSLLPIPSVVFCSSPLSLSLPPYSSLMDCVIRHQRIPIAIGHTGIKLVCYFFSSPSLPFSFFFFFCLDFVPWFSRMDSFPGLFCFKFSLSLLFFPPEKKKQLLKSSLVTFVFVADVCVCIFVNIEARREQSRPYKAL